jgi:hypothetical protein
MNQPSIRIGDEERDAAVASLSDHFAAGRLNRDELDERIDNAMQARFDADLVPLFADLPTGSRAVAVPPANPMATFAGRPVVQVRVPALLWLMPIMLVGLVVTAVALGAPWLLWGLFWIMIVSRFAGHRQHVAHGWPQQRR